MKFIVLSVVLVLVGSGEVMAQQCTADEVVVGYDKPSGVGTTFYDDTVDTNTCKIDSSFRIYDGQGKRLNEGTRETQSGWITLKAKFQSDDDRDLSQCTTRDSESFDVKFYAKLGQPSDTSTQWVLLEKDGDYTQQVEIDRLDSGQDTSAELYYYIIEGPGSVISFKLEIDTDNNEVRMTEEQTRTETLNVVVPPTYDIVLSDLTPSGSVQVGRTRTFSYNVSNVVANTTPSDIGIVHFSDNTQFETVRTGVLQPGESRQLTMTMSPSQVGTERKKACYQGSDFQELRSDNNCTNIGNLTVTEAPKRPFGNIETMSCSGFKGWIRDQSATARRIEIYRNSTRQFSLWANKYRSDVKARWGGNGQSGYDLGFPWNLKNGKSYTWKVYAIDDGVGGTTLSKTEIDGKTFRCNNTLPSGRLEHATRTSVHGWAWDPDRPNNPINIHVYTEAGYRGGGNAPWWRSDLPGNRQHAFNITVDNLCWRVTDGWANVRVAYLDTLTGRRWSNTLNLPCN